MCLMPGQGYRFVLVLSVIAFGATKCAANVVWLPDSSAIFFTDKGGSRLVQYDLERKARTILVKDTKTITLQPAISPDGKSLAVAAHRLHFTKDSNKAKATFQIVIYDIDGKERRRSKLHTFHYEFDKARTETAEVLTDTPLYWSGPADKMLVVFYAGLGPKLETNYFGLSLRGISTLIYDLKADTYREVKGSPLDCQNRPIRPDGKGFLLQDWDKDHQLSYCDWQGQRKGMEMPELGDSLHVSWAKDKVRFIGFTQSFEFDTQTGKFEEVKGKLVLLAPPGEGVEVFNFAGGKTWLCLYHYPKDRGKAKKAHLIRLETQYPADKKRKVISEEEYRVGGTSLFPSSDDQLVALRCGQADNEEKEWILVIDAKGTIVAKVEVER